MSDNTNSKTTKTDSAISSFLVEIDDIKPLDQDKVISSPTTKLADQSVSYRKKAALNKALKYENFLTDGEIEFVQPDEVLSFKISGLQPNVFKNLRRAKYQFDYHLDLHRMTVEQSRNAVFGLISQADTEGLRCFKITHGKGLLSPQPAKLKSYVNHWLKQIEQVVAFHSALPQHGGTGSVYVLLKKPKGQPRINPAKYE
ncbi:MAG: DNA endonuclease SmrA [Kangiellaceae bacterium]|nr:DNA endonuclease SmrA [Kangiellaceae bacterium]